MENTVADFFRRHAFVVDGLDREALMQAFLSEMELGLRGEESSLLMIPTFVSCAADVRRGVRVAVLDAGGTNLRGATVELAADGSGARVEHLEKGPMPGVAREVSEEEFYGALAAHVTRTRPYVDDSTVGFCFSYTAEASADGDAKLLMWTKNIKAPAIVGQWVGAQLARRLSPRPRQVRVINDTVATLLAGLSLPGAERYSATLGFILGTGTNVAYVERNGAIAKLAHLGLDPEARQCINSESAGFDKIAQSDFDRAMDARMPDPGSQVLEKMISGAYLGRIALEVLRAAAGEGLLSAAGAAGVGALADLESREASDFCAGDADGVLAHALPDEADRALARELLRPVFRRAVILTGVHLAAFAARTGAGRDPARPICICADGSTYHKTRAVSFPEIVKAEMERLLAGRGIHFEIRACPSDAPLIGAAVAALAR